MRKLVVVAVVAGSLAAAIQAPLAGAAPNRTTGSVVHIAAVANGLKFDKKTLHATAGSVTLVFTNRSHIKHDVRLEIGEKEYGGTKKIGHGTTRVTLTLAKGTYHFYCSVPGHEDAGMSGYLYVS
jgi:uncharacterized cupredoxin-like copper-binding protein